MSHTCLHITEQSYEFHILPFGPSYTPLHNQPELQLSRPPFISITCRTPLFRSFPRSRSRRRRRCDIDRCVRAADSFGWGSCGWPSWWFAYWCDSRSAGPCIGPGRWPSWSPHCYQFHWFRPWCCVNDHLASWCGATVKDDFNEHCLYNAWCIKQSSFIF